MPGKHNLFLTSPGLARLMAPVVRITARLNADDNPHPGHCFFYWIAGWMRFDKLSARRWLSAHRWLSLSKPANQ